MSSIRRGSAAIQEAAESSQRGGTFKPYIPSIYWNEDGQERFVLILNELEDIPLFDMVGFIPTDGGDGPYMEAVAKTDPFFGDKSDAFEEQWDATIRKTNVCIAVELEPRVEIVNKRRKPKGFEVKTVEYERTILDDDGEPTEDKEEVVAPAIGYIAQSPNNFFNVLANYDANDAPISSTPLKITRLGKDVNTTYTVQGYDGQEIDLTNLVEYVEGISYLKDEMSDLLDAITDVPAEEAAVVIGTVLLDKRIEELIDPERYDELLEGVTESMDKFGNKKKKNKGKKGNAAAERATSRRRARQQPEADAGDDSGDEPDEPATDPGHTEEVEPTTKAKASKKDGVRKQTGNTAQQNRMAELRKRAKAAK